MNPPGLAEQTGHIARRSIARSFRQPVIIIPTILFPLFFLAIQAGGVDEATDIPGFPTDSYLTFALGAIFIQGAVSAATVAGDGLGTDIHTGFLNRLSLTTLRGPALLAGNLAGAVVVGLIQVVLYLVVGLIAGAHNESGVGGALVLVGLMLLVSLAFGAIGLWVALRSGGAEAVQAVFPLCLALLFMSSMVMPRNLIDKGWFEVIADYNPMSYFIEAPRSLLIDGWDAEALALGFGIAAGILLLALLSSVRQLRGRIERT